MKSFNDRKDFRDFIKKKNRLLEFVLDYYMGRMDKYMDMLPEIVEKAAVFYTWRDIDQYHNLLKKFSATIDPQFDTIASIVASLYLNMKKTCYALSYEADNVALSQMLGSAKKPINIHRYHNQKSYLGGDVAARTYHAFNNLKTKVEKAFGTALLISDTQQEAVESVLQVLPKKRTYQDVPRVIQIPRPLKEAARPRKPQQFGFMTQEVWDALVDDYLSEIPNTRDPAAKVMVPSKTGKKRERYAWELEKDITNDFVKDVRDGQHDAAKANGIKDFMWIAVVDDRTDECCLWRDGLTTSEIEQQLRGKHKSDECQTAVPPAHPNCRCDIAPITDPDKLGDAPELGDFESWLSQK